MENHRHVQEGREKEPLHKLGESLESLTNSYCKQHDDTTTIFIAADKSGYVFGSNGNSPKNIAKALINAATKDKIVSDALQCIIEQVLSVLPHKQ